MQGYYFNIMAYHDNNTLFQNRPACFCLQHINHHNIRNSFDTNNSDVASILPSTI